MALSWLSRRKIRSPRARAEDELHRMGDVEDNAQGRAAADQQFRTWGVWAVEAYTPSNFSNLCAGLERIQSGSFGPEGHPAAWLRRQRSYPGSRYNLQFSPLGRKFPFRTFEVELPSFASAVSGTVWCATPSLTLLTLSFDLNDEQKSRLDNILHAYFPTRVTPIGGSGAWISDPDLERRRNVNLARAEWAAEAKRWINERFPGLFSRDSAELPTFEFTEAQGLEPFGSGESNPRDILVHTALNWTWHAPFVSDGQLTGLHFVPFSYVDDESAWHSLLAMSREAFEALDGSHWGTTFSYLEHTVRPMVGQWAIHRVLDHFRAKICTARDTLADVVAERSAVRSLSRVRTYTVECADAATVARDIESCISDNSLRMEGPQMRLTDEAEVEADLRMASILRNHLTERASALLRDVNEINANLHAQAALLSAHSNLRLQPWIILLAIVSTAVGLIAAIPPAKEILGFGTPVQVSAPAVTPVVQPRPQSPARMTQS